eukprot:TRINITY_DN75311_c0_g1_i1.p1 TRINITY_DN75311_c0_g1~~TRINITY_DN75311_c0_g1_i1.p1  ORF type:complete len:230 (-),score=31.68 TRINITY_DN75311_c0_g1_i1:296-985(-)
MGQWESTGDSADAKHPNQADTGMHDAPRDGAVWQPMTPLASSKPRAFSRRPEGASPLTVEHGEQQSNLLQQSSTDADYGVADWQLNRISQHPATPSGMLSQRPGQRPLLLYRCMSPTTEEPPSLERTWSDSAFGLGTKQLSSPTCGMPGTPYAGEERHDSKLGEASDQSSRLKRCRMCEGSISGVMEDMCGNTSEDPYAEVVESRRVLSGDHEEAVVVLPRHKHLSNSL